MTSKDRETLKKAGPFRVIYSQGINVCYKKSPWELHVSAKEAVAILEELAGAIERVLNEACRGKRKPL